MDETLISHPSDSELDAFLERTSPAPVLMQLDRHLAECPACRTRLQERTPVEATCSWLRATLNDAVTQEHLSEEDVQLCATGATSQEAAEHLRVCAICQSEVDDLRQFIAVRPPERMSGRTWMWAAAAAALLIAATAALWLVRMRAEPDYVAHLRDSGGVLGLDRNGSLHSPVPLLPNYATSVAQAMAAGRVDWSHLPGITRKPEFLLGDSGRQAPFVLENPIGEAVATDLPQFSWALLPDPSTYRVDVYDQSFHRVAESEDLRFNTWTCTSRLPTGAVYSWTVTAHTGSRPDIREPAPPSPEAKFAVMPQEQMDQLTEAERRYPNAHLLLAILYAKGGALRDAHRHLDALRMANPDSDLARRIAASLPR